MFRRMVEVEEELEDFDDRCMICLEALEDKELIELSSKFGCDCKNKVHQDCLTIWIIRKAKRMGRNTSSCIVCSQEIEIGKIKRSELSEYVLSNIIVDDVGTGSSNGNSINNVVIINELSERYTRKDIIRMTIGGSIMFGLIALFALVLLGELK